MTYMKKRDLISLPFWHFIYSFALYTKADVRVHNNGLQGMLPEEIGGMENLGKKQFAGFFDIVVFFTNKQLSIVNFFKDKL